LNLKSPEQALFLYELLYLDHLISDMSSLSSVSDDVPDFIAFSFASFSNLLLAYEPNSKVVRKAAAILDLAIPSIMSRVNEVYNGRVVTELVLLSSSSVLPRDPSPALREQISRFLPGEEGYGTYFPSFYVSNAYGNTICQLLSGDLRTYGYEAYCPDSFIATKQFSTILTTGYNSNSSSSTTTVMHYQITLWISILLVLMVLFAVYSLAFMSFKKDTLLYSTFNPNWEERKRR